jgi:hypothetical protein
MRPFLFAKLMSKFFTIGAKRRPRASATDQQKQRNLLFLNGYKKVAQVMQ